MLKATYGTEGTFNTLRSLQKVQIRVPAAHKTIRIVSSYNTTGISYSGSRECQMLFIPSSLSLLSNIADKLNHAKCTAFKTHLRHLFVQVTH